MYFVFGNEASTENMLQYFVIWKMAFLVLWSQINLKEIILFVPEHLWHFLRWGVCRFDYESMPWSQTSFFSCSSGLWDDASRGKFRRIAPTDSHVLVRLPAPLVHHARERMAIPRTCWGAWWGKYLIFLVL